MRHLPNLFCGWPKTLTGADRRGEVPERSAWSRKLLRRFTDPLNSLPPQYQREGSYLTVGIGCTEAGTGPS